jgi:hypothetical protein
MIAEPAQVNIEAGERQPRGEAGRDALRPSLVRILFHHLLDPVALAPPFGKHREVDLAGGDRPPPRRPHEAWSCWFDWRMSSPDG